jgi:hypothetical protein
MRSKRCKFVRQRVAEGVGRFLLPDLFLLDCVSRNVGGMWRVTSGFCSAHLIEVSKEIGQLLVSKS